MIRHIWSVLCQASITDRETNTLTLFRVHESIAAVEEPTESKPAVLPLEIVTLWARQDANEPCKGELRAYYVSPSGKRGAEIELDIDLTGTNFHRSILRSPGFPLTSPGVYNFFIEYRDDAEQEWIRASAIPLVVLVAPKPDTQSPA